MSLVGSAAMAPIPAPKVTGKIAATTRMIFLIVPSSKFLLIRSVHFYCFEQATLTPMKVSGGTARKCGIRPLDLGVSYHLVPRYVGPNSLFHSPHSHISGNVYMPPRHE